MHTMYDSCSYNQNSLNVMELISKHLFMEIIWTLTCGAMMNINYNLEKRIKKD